MTALPTAPGRQTWGYRFGRGLAFLIAIPLVVLMFAAPIWFAWWAFQNLSFERATGLAALGATPVATVAAVIVASQLNKSREIEQDARKQRLPMYDEFLAFWFKSLASTRHAQFRSSADENVEFFQSFTRKLVVWGSADLLKRWGEFKRS